MRTIIEADREGVAERVFHRSGGKVWTHALDELCLVCQPKTSEEEDE